LIPTDELVVGLSLRQGGATALPEAWQHQAWLVSEAEVVVTDWVEVGCYAGGRGDETPRMVLLGGREVTLRVEHRWLEEPVRPGGSERRRMFQVRLEDGRRCRLAQEPDGSWTLSHMADGHERSRPGQVDGGT
jgi:hypothetical protein